MKPTYPALLLLPLLLLLITCSKKDGDSFSIDSFYPTSSGDRYNVLEENPFIQVDSFPVSTFSIDADGASYSNMRRFLLQDDMLPPKAAIRTEELINYFNLDYPFSSSDHPITLNGEVSTCPWSTGNKLIRIGIKGRPLKDGVLPPTNFVFLIDVSGSMKSADKLDLLKQGFTRFVDELDADDRISIVTYAGSAAVLLRGESGDQKSAIKSAINKLGAGGSTAGAEGIITAYEIALENFIEGGNNRIILGSDGDFNVGISDQESLIELIEEQRDSGVYLTVLGVGRGNLNDGSMEQIANHGNGTYEYIDNTNQLMKVFVYEASKFETVAKDVKVQVKFNPLQVASYRLIGYENRLLSEADFENDSTDAGEIGANQSITALYEIIPASTVNLRQEAVFTIDFRYKLPTEDFSNPMELPIYDEGNTFEESSDHQRFVSSITAFSMVMTKSSYKGTANYTEIVDWLEAINLPDPYGFKSELKELVLTAQSKDQ